MAHNEGIDSPVEGPIEREYAGEADWMLSMGRLRGQSWRSWQRENLCTRIMLINDVYKYFILIPSFAILNSHTIEN